MITKQLSGEAFVSTMEAIIFCCIQGAGKTTFYKQFFFKTHIRISLDLLHPRNKEDKFLLTCFLTCFATQQRLVIDNTNPTRLDRRKYIDWCKAYKFRTIGYYFESSVEDAIHRNKQRIGKECVPDVGIKGTFKKLEVPAYDEGFDLLYKVTISHEGFHVEEMRNANP